jgi:integrase/recombinase XerC
MTKNTILPVKNAKKAEFERISATFENWLRNRNRSEQTISLYLNVQNRLFLHILNFGLELVNLRESDLEKFFASLGSASSRRITGATRAVYFSALKTFFHFLERAGEIKASPLQHFERPRVEVREPRVLTKEEYQRLLGVVRDNVKMRAILEIFLQTGMRISELVSLRMVDFQVGGSGGLAKLIVRQGKGGKDRINFLPGSAVQAVQTWLKIRPADSDFLFVSRFGRGYSARGLRKVINRLFGLVGLAGAKVHSLRHTFCTHQLRNGSNIRVVMQQVGHSSIATTQKYLHLLDDWGEEICRNSL